MSDNLYLAAWCNEGLECLINITQKEKSALFDILADKNPAPFDKWLQHTVSMLTMRARYNSQRHYEIYSFWVDDSMEEYEIKRIFEDAPQEIVNLIRVKGNKIFSDRAEKNKVVIE